ncbi:hypothetical protein fugu_003781 [Takifugu bimaculatus]|uniref:PH domain-containing protein n=1 Tax=Takifugu bimaculatus TaxID=433685 RepID=A0A4Z2BCK5_9TELE|nr:hypothetical protein fugu_003781 [Takifugu bimaculatus]
MPYVDRLNRICGFLDIEEKENSCRFQRRYFILDTQGNALLWYMDNPQNLPSGASSVGSLKLTYISKVSEATVKQKPKVEFCFERLRIGRVPKAGPASPRTDVATVISDPQGRKRQQAYKTEIIGGVVVHTPIQNDTEEPEGRDRKGNRPGVLRCSYCVKQGNVRKSWKRRFFTLDDNAVSYYKSDMDKEPLRSIPLRDIQKVHECLVKSGDLLLRDNLFEIITSFRTFYIQTDSPEEMHGWIRDIDVKIQEFRGPPKAFSFKSAPSLYRTHNSSMVSHARQSNERRPQLMKSCSVSAGWQPWMPVPPERDLLAGRGRRRQRVQLRSHPALALLVLHLLLHLLLFKLPLHPDPLPQRSPGVFDQQPRDRGGVGGRGLRAPEAPLAAPASEQLQLPLQSG